MRYILFCLDKTPDPDDLRRIANAPGVRIIAHSVPRALLVEASGEAIDKLRPDLENWRISEEVVYALPSCPTGNIRPGKNGV